MNISANTSVSGTDQLNQTGASQPDVQASRARSSAASGEVKDQTRLSANQDQTGQLSALVAQQPEVRQDRVAAVSQALSNGTYQVSNQQIAGAISDEYALG
jgi:flagellar biosynthesis anti-sigma factor FlgM